MKPILAAIAAAGLLGGAGMAVAADLSPRIYAKAVPADPGYNWSGFYAGINAGYGIGSASSSLALNAVEQRYIRPGLDNPLPPTLRPEGFVGGGQAGFNFQSGRIVAGLEADLDYSNLRKTDAATGAPYVGGILTTTVATSLDWFGTVRGRFGVLPVDNVLLYATGGVAYGSVRTTTTGSNRTPINCDGGHIYWAIGSTSGISVGWTVGGGIEYAFARNWTVKAEYLYLDLGNSSVNFIDHDVSGGAMTATTGFTAHIARAGLNYRF